jgi:hypothetical protein
MSRFLSKILAFNFSSEDPDLHWIKNFVDPDPDSGKMLDPDPDPD